MADPKAVTKPEPSQEDYQTWLKGPKLSSLHCATCADYPHLVPKIRKFLDAKKAGETEKSLRQFLNEFLKPKMGYKLEEGAFRNHVAKCEGETDLARKKNK